MQAAFGVKQKLPSEQRKPGRLHLARDDGAGEGECAGHPRVFTVGGLPGSILRPEPLCSSSLQDVPPCPRLCSWFSQMVCILNLSICIFSVNLPFIYASSLLQTRELD